MSIKYYVSTYSAHASLLTKLANNKQSEIKKLCVSYGGLKVPKGSFNESNWKPIFKNLFESKQVLHAKVILKQNAHNNELWLWTGNLRSCTKKSQNILISLRINNSLASNIISWFNDGPNKHLVLNKSTKITAKPFAGAMVSILSESIKKLDENNCNKTYIFSPWGSSEVLEDLLKCNQVKNVKIYTRFALGKMWLDFNSKKIISRNIADEKAEFPHLKCMFITNVKGNIIWAYIGSANFTKQAMKRTIKEKSNIEYALIVEGEDACKQLMPILDRLKSGQKKWIIRQRIGKGYNHINDGEDVELGLEETGDEDFNNNFKTREIIKECGELIDKEQEKIFDDFYKKGDSDEHPFKKDKNYLFKVMGVGVFFHLLVQKKNREWVEMPYKRTIPDMIPYGCIEADQSVENIFKALKQKPKSTKPTNNEIQNSSSTLSIQDRNLRFPYDRLKNRRIRSIIETELIKLNKNRESISCNYRKLVDLWLPMINLMNKKGIAK
ncbi:hypothetical protein [Fibrobacter sp.]|uniref:hypothetical protein n=1 Tax=Fibrobacter sp. TaxID=35828 RepID=UPI0025B9DFB0|nr:hypothetical protein [Fibrobacter sp.]MBR3070686.1 hypothetical protein [Fibrobacter sp.]